MTKTLPAPTSTKGVTPDGKRIKELRRKLGKTQKGLIKSSTIQLRTYQRAEQGLPIMQESLQQIGLLLSADPAQLRLDRTQQSVEQENSFRLGCVSSDGATRLVNELQGWPGNVEYRFAINPRGEVADKVAEVIEFCQALEFNQGDDPSQNLSPAQKIRAIGRLNDMLSALAESKVYTYAGAYLTWTVESETSPDIIWEESGKPVTYRKPRTSSNLRLIFSDQEHPFILGTYSSWESKKEAFKRAINSNLEHQVNPDWIEEDFFDDEFIETYREAYAKKLGMEPQLQLAPPDEPME